MTAAVATVKGGYFSQYGVTMSSISGHSGSRRRVAQALGQRGNRPLRTIARALNGVAPGALASSNDTRIVASSELGGKRAIETVPFVNRITTAGDVTEIQNYWYAFYSRNTLPSPANKDGNPLGTR